MDEFLNLCSRILQGHARIDEALLIVTGNDRRMAQKILDNGPWDPIPHVKYIFKLTILTAYAAYRELYMAELINRDKIYNLASHSFDPKAYPGEIGFLDKKVLVFANSWEEMSGWKDLVDHTKYLEEGKN